MSAGGGGSVLARAVVVLEGDSSKLDDVMTAAESHMMKLGESLKKAGENLTTHITLPLVALGTLAVHSWGEHADAIAKMDAMLTASGGAAGATSEHLQALGLSLQETTAFSHDTTDSAMAMLLSFQDVRNEVGKGNAVFDRTVKVAQDLSVLMDKDLRGAMLALAKTMEDPAQGMMLLRRSGIVLSQQVQQQIKDFNAQNDVVSAQKLVLAEVEKRVGGLSAAMAKTPFGQMHQGWNAITTALEGFGKIIFQFIQPGIDLVKRWAKQFEGLSDAQKKTVVIMAAVTAGIGPLLVGIGTAIVAFTLLGVTLGVAAGPLALALLAFVALEAGIIAVVTHWSDVKLQVLTFWQFIKDAFFTGVDWILGKLLVLVHGGQFAFGFLSKVPGTLGAAFGLLKMPMDAAAAGLQLLRGSLGAAAQEDSEKYAKALAEMNKEIEKVGAASTETSKKVAAAVAGPARVPTWTGAVLIALRELRKEQDENTKKFAVMGEQFDFTGAQAKSYAKAVDAIGKTYVSLDTKLDGTGLTLRKMLSTLVGLENSDIIDKFSKEIAEAGKQQSVLGKQFDWAAAVANAYQSAVSALTAKHVDLDKALNAEGLTLRMLLTGMAQMKTVTIWQQFTDSLDAAAKMVTVLGSGFDSTAAKLSAYQGLVQSAIAEHKALTDKIGDTGKTLGELIVDMNRLDATAQIAANLRSTFNSGLDAAVAFAFGAKQSFADFVRSALTSLAQLMVRILAMAALKKMFDGKDIFGVAASKLLGFADGGFLPAGLIGLVGERGPELMMAGASGVTITPMPAMSAAGASSAGGSDVMHLHFNVQAIDQSGVARFFEQNSNLVAGAMMKARQRSQVFRRGLEP